MRVRRKSRTIPILLLLAMAILSQSLITTSAVLEYPAIYIDPATIGPNGYGIDTEFNISICTNYTGTDIWGWSFALTYNPLVLEGVGVFNGNLTTDPPYPAVFNAGNFTHYTGELSTTEASFNVTQGQPVNVTSGPGILAKVTFKVVGWGDSEIKLGDETRLIGYSGGEFYDIIDAVLMPDHIGHGYFRNEAEIPTHDIAVISVEPNETEVLAPAPVSINVTIKNNGTADERFAVKVYYKMIHPEFFIDSVMVDLTAGDFWSDVFIWDTTYALEGNHTIIAKAGPVMLETDTVNNKNEEACVNVYSPYIAVVPEREINPDKRAGTYWVSIYTDYNSTEVVGSNDVSSYEFTLTYNPSVLEGVNVTNGGGMPQTDTWVGDNSTTVYNTSITPVMSGTETVYVNGTKMKKPADYTINYATGAITFDTAPDWVFVEVEYWYEMSLMPGATFTEGNFVDGQLTLTSASVASPVSGPGVLATVNFNVLDIGESDIELGTGTKLKRSDESNIIMPHRLKLGYFTNMGDAAMLRAGLFGLPGQTKVEAYPMWIPLVNITIETQNVWGAPNFTVTAYYGKGVDIEIENKSVINLADDAKETVTIGWNLSGVAWGEYVVSAGVAVPTGDHNNLNDFDSDGTVLVKIPGDINGDAKSDKFDFGDFATAFGSHEGEPRYNPDADLNMDGKIDKFDFGWFATYFGTKLPGGY